MKPKITSRDEISKRILTAKSFGSAARVSQIHPGIQFSMAYEAARIWCEIVLRAEGLLVSGGGGHHEKTIKGAAKTLGPEFGSLFDYIDLARKSRSRVNYEGELEQVTQKDAQDLSATVDKLEMLVTDWLMKNHPDLMPLV